MRALVGAASLDELYQEVPRAGREVGLDGARLFLLAPGQERLVDGGGNSLPADGPDVAARSVLKRATVVEGGEIGTPVIVEGRVVGAVRAGLHAVDDPHRLEALAESVSAGVVAAGLRQDLNQLFMYTAEWLGAAQEALVPGGSGHISRVGLLATQLAEALGFSLHDRHRIWLAAQVHDLGTVIGVDRDFHEHPTIAAEALRQVRMLAPAADVVEVHHERFDGTGYPLRLSGADIPLEGYVLGLADAFDEAAVAAGLVRPGRRAEAGREVVLNRFCQIFVAEHGSAHHPKVLAALQDVPLRQVYP